MKRKKDTYDLEIHCLQISTGEPHPEASQSPFCVQAICNTPPSRSEIKMDILGDTLALVAHGSPGPAYHCSPCRFYLLDWKTGEQKMVGLNLMYSLHIF